MATILSKLSLGLQQTLAELGYTKLTPVQEQAIPHLLAGLDVIAQSKTGSGKTAAFALPMLNRLNSTRRTQALILCPTRELCAQVAREVRKFGRRQPGLQVLAIAGGQPFRPQAMSLQNGVHVVVGTPGRVLDHIRRSTLFLDTINTLILDEADRMLDMGFEEDMREILDACPSQRQTALFSATYPPGIAAISQAYQRRPQRVAISDDSSKDGAAANTPPIKQLVIEADADDKVPTLLWLLRDRQPKSAIVFCNMKANATEVASALSEAGVSAAALHGDLEQRDRDKVLAKFRNRSTRVLVATDVAARGLDIEAVDIVFNLDVPSKPEVYVHRIGRTGRAGKSGLAIAIATSREDRKIDAIESYTSTSMQRIESPSAPALAARPAASGSQDAPMATLRIGGGRKAKVRPGDILGALTGEAGGIPAEAVGKIEIHDFFAYVAVSRHVARAACASLMAGRIKGRKFAVELEQ